MRKQQEPGPRSGRILGRLLGGAALIALLTTVAISTAAVETVSQIAAILQKGGLIKSADLSPVGGGAPTTILILGSDRRVNTAIDASNPPHSDTILLVHLDPQKGTTSELSVPRDFYTQFTYKGQSYSSKINYAYTLGGAKLSVHVIEGLLHIKINYAIDLSFHAFDQVVDKLGCVYVDVDHLYLNPPGNTYATIDVRPGYQRLCGQHALDYVRYRHDDNTFARDAREQAFLRDAKAQLGLSGLLSHGTDIINALAKSINSNIRGTSEVSGLIDTITSSINGPVRQVAFPDTPLTLANGEQDQTATRAQIASAVAQFLDATPQAPLVASNTAPAPTAHRNAGARTLPSAPNLTPTPASIRNEASVSLSVRFPVYLPAQLTVSSYADPYEPFSTYTVRDSQGALHHGYRVDFATGGIGSYWGIEGMDWTNPPLFAHADVRVRYGRHYLLVGNGRHIQDIGWIVGKDLYWVSNTIFDDLSNSQMLAIAESSSAM